MVVVLIGYAGFKWYVQRVVLAIMLADFMQCTRAREEILAVLVKWDTHASVGEVEGLLHSVSMMHVDIEVEHPWVDLQQL